MKTTYIQTLKILLLTLLFFSFFYCSDKEEIVLAKVGNFEINSSDYMKRFKKVRERLSVPDNGEMRLNFLKSYIDEKLLLTESHRLGYDADAAAQEKQNTIKLQNLLDIYLEKEVYQPINVTDDDLKRYFAKMNIKLKLRHLYSDNKNTADSLYTLLKSGVSFNDLARKVFNDPRLKETGGDLGYMGVNEMQIDFADAAYRLEIGQFSRPVKTNYGYSIIKIEDRLGNPFLTETEFLKQKPAILASYYKYAKKRAAKDHSRGLQTDININQALFDKLYDEFKPRLSTGGATEPLSQKTSVGEDEIFISSDLISWDVRAFKQKAKFTSENQRNWIRNKETFKEYILGLVAREQVVRQAKDKGYDTLAEYQENVEKEFNEYAIDRLKRDVLESIKTPYDSLVNFYQVNQGAFIEPGKINLREIVLDNHENVDRIKALLIAGEAFAALARNHSLNRHTAVFGGEMGFTYYSEFGALSDRVKALKPGEWIGPLKRGSVFFFWQCIEQSPARLKSFKEAENELISKYKTMRFDIALQVKIDEIKSRTYVAAYPKKLKELKYN